MIETIASHAANIGQPENGPHECTRTRLGMLTPSSNSVLEPVTCTVLAGVPRVSAHFSRFRVTEIALDADALDQFDRTRMLPAADLLADAKVDAIVTTIARGRVVVDHGKIVGERGRGR